jgi:hypothetical protein
LYAHLLLAALFPGFASSPAVVEFRKEMTTMYLSRQGLIGEGLMNKILRIRFSWIVVPLLLSALACSFPQLTAQAVPPPTLAIPPSVAPPADTATPPFQGAIPVGLPAKRADQAGDVDSSANAYRKMVSGGDVFVHNLYERPFNANTMDKYFPYLDIVDTQGFKDDTWGYATITLENADANGKLPGQYAVELDLDKNGRGDWLIRVANPSSTEWSTERVRAWKDSDGDIGGVAIMAADTIPRGGNGYETLVFDQGKGTLTDGAWARIKSDDPKTVEIAFKLSMLGNPSSYAMGAWAGTTIDPALFDYDDHMTHAQAGSPIPGYVVYPLKAMAEIDNTCRLAIGFVPNGKEPGLCVTVQRLGEASPPCIPKPCSLFAAMCPATCP